MKPDHKNVIRHGAQVGPTTPNRHQRRAEHVQAVRMAQAAYKAFCAKCKAVGLPPSKSEFIRMVKEQQS